MKIDLDLVRHYFDDKYTVGKLYVSGEYVCDTLEPAKVGSYPCIPSGDYNVVLAPSPKFGKLMPRLCNVPGRVGILIHQGNSPKDTHGCILVGYNDLPGGLLNSKRTFTWLMALLASVDESVVIHIKNK